MFCKDCGKRIPDDSKFCPYCGASMVEVANVEDKRQSDVEVRIDSHRYNRNILGFATQTKEKEVLKPVAKWIYSFVTASVALSVLCIIMAISVIAITPSIAHDSKAFGFKKAWYIVAGIYFLVVGGINFAVYFVTKGKAYLQPRSFSKQQLPARIINLIFCVVASIMLFITVSKLFANPAAADKNVFCILGPCISCGLLFFDSAITVGYNTVLQGFLKAAKPLTIQR